MEPSVAAGSVGAACSLALSRCSCFTCRRSDAISPISASIRDPADSTAARRASARRPLADRGVEGEAFPRTRCSRASRRCRIAPACWVSTRRRLEGSSSSVGSSSGIDQSFERGVTKDDKMRLSASSDRTSLPNTLSTSWALEESSAAPYVPNSVPGEQTEGEYVSIKWFTRVKSIWNIVWYLKHASCAFFNSLQ